MKKLVLVVVFFIFACSGESRGENITMDEFKELSLQKKSEYINNLKPHKRMELLEKFLPGNCFNIPPNTSLKFFSDGTVVFEWLIDDPSLQNMAGGKQGGPYTFHTAFWKIENDRLIFKKDLTNPDSKDISEIADRESWWDFITEYKVLDNGRISLIDFNFQKSEPVKPGYSEGGGFEYVGPGSGFLCDSPSIQEYSRLKAEGKK